MQKTNKDWLESELIYSRSTSEIKAELLKAKADLSGDEYNKLLANLPSQLAATKKLIITLSQFDDYAAMLKRNLEQPNSMGRAYFLYFCHHLQRFGDHIIEPCKHLISNAGINDEAIGNIFDHITRRGFNAYLSDVIHIYLPHASESLLFELKEDIDLHSEHQTLRYCSKNISKINDFDRHIACALSIATTPNTEVIEYLNASDKRSMKAIERLLEHYPMSPVELLYMPNLSERTKSILYEMIAK